MAAGKVAGRGHHTHPSTREPQQSSDITSVLLASTNPLPPSTFRHA